MPRKRSKTKTRKPRCLAKKTSQEKKSKNETPQDESGFAYTVKEDDWLTKLARDYLGSEDRYQEIRDATNAKAKQDPTFATIEDDNLIYPGEVIWIPQR